MQPPQTNNKNTNDSIPSQELSTATSDKTPSANNLPPDPSANQSPKLSTRTKILRILGVIAFVIISLLFIGYVALYLLLSGGISGVIHDMKSPPKPLSSKVVSKRNDTTKTLENSFAQIEQKHNFKSYALSKHDVCYKGRNNFKIRDKYAHRCTLKLTKYYGFNTDFKTEMIKFEEGIYNFGWRSASPGDDDYPLKNSVERYYVAEDGTGNSLEDDASEHSNSPRLPMPFSGYRRENSVLRLDYFIKGDTDLFSIEFAQNASIGAGSVIYENKDFNSMSTLFRKITRANNFVLIVSIQDNYFEN